MNTIYQYHIDIWLKESHIHGVFKTKKEALEFRQQILGKNAKEPNPRMLLGSWPYGIVRNFLTQIKGE